MDVLVEGLSFPEAPRWHAGSFYFSDFYTHSVLRVDADGSLVRIAEVKGRPSGLGFTADGGVLIVSMLEKKVLKLLDGTLATFADLAGLAGGPCNDMLVTKEGRAYVGNFGFDRHGGEAERPTRLIRVEPDGSVVQEAGELLFPNGMALTPDGRTLVVAETNAGRITAFSVGADGALSGQRTFAQLDGFKPDGLCMDAEGAIWVTDIEGHRIIRVLDGGRIAQTIETGERMPFACMLGGQDLRTLFVCTNSGFGPKMAEKREGRIEAARVDIAGFV